MSDKRIKRLSRLVPDTKVIDSIENPIKLVLWDMEGADPFETDKRSISRIQSYIKGAHGLIRGADGTRPATVETALGLYHDFCRNFNDVPAVMLANKADLKTEWRFDESILPDSLSRYETSALKDKNVEAAFSALGHMLSRL